MTEKRIEIQGKLNLVRVGGKLELTGFCCIELLSKYLIFTDLTYCFELERT